MRQEMVGFWDGSGISWTICKQSAPRSRDITTSTPHHTRKVKPIWVLLKQETVSGSGISWAICKSAPHSRQITTPAPCHSSFYRPDALPATQPTASKHWRYSFGKTRKAIPFSRYCSRPRRLASSCCSDSWNRRLPGILGKLKSGNSWCSIECRWANCR